MILRALVQHRYSLPTMLGAGYEKVIGNKGDKRIWRQYEDLRESLIPTIDTYEIQLQFIESMLVIIVAKKNR